MSDEEFLDALRALSTSALRIVRVEVVDAAHALACFSARGRLWGLVLPLPSAWEPRPWEYATPDDARESVGMLGVFLDEEVLTTAIETARSTQQDGMRLVELALYGLRRLDDQEHARLSNT